jgi:hypothetical protein
LLGGVQSRVVEGIGASQAFAYPLKLAGYMLRKNRIGTTGVLDLRADWLIFLCHFKSFLGGFVRDIIAHF